MFLQENVGYKDVAKLLFDYKIISIFQGRSEAGPRALGNRSMLYTPTDPNGKNYINSIKGREQFRPLAASILYEHAHDWFDMMGIDESPYMTFSFACKKEKAEIIPCVIHVDGSCRIQTIKKDQNLHYYNLIEAFYNISNVPMLLNTSFNLAGEPIVETPEDAMRTFKNSKIDCLYFPELEMLLQK
jgi:carbamoyltransferase